ncbi:MAG: hypothetical protein MZW92_47500 [Comamonadaceae bacterium]|nr:hypothetical protein [Comamonadaceae bacterium]
MTDGAILLADNAGGARRRRAGRHRLHGAPPLDTPVAVAGDRRGGGNALRQSAAARRDGAGGVRERETGRHRGDARRDRRRHDAHPVGAGDRPAGGRRVQVARLVPVDGPAVQTDGASRRPLERRLPLRGDGRGAAAGRRRRAPRARRQTAAAGPGGLLRAPLRPRDQAPAAAADRADAGQPRTRTRAPAGLNPPGHARARRARWPRPPVAKPSSAATRCLRARLDRMREAVGEAARPAVASAL